MSGVVIEVKLANDRRQAGTLVVRKVGGQVLLADIPVLGRADQGTAERMQNASADPLKPFGNTPLGGYGVTQIISTGPGTPYDAVRYGPNGAIRLEPVSGDALVAKLNGRTGLLIHAGREKANGKLTPTNGCLRVSNSNMRRIIDAIVSASNNAAQNRCEVLQISVGVADSSPDEGIDDGDPPPTTPGPVILP